MDLRSSLGMLKCRACQALVAKNSFEKVTCQGH